MGTLLGPSKIFALLNIQDCSLKILGQTVTTTMAVSGVTIGCIAYDRFLYVKSINHYNNKRTQQHLLVLVIVPWFMVIVLLATKLASEFSNAIIVLCLVLGIYAFIIFCYTKLIQLLRRSAQIVAKNGGNTASSTANTERNLKMVNFIKLILVTAIVFTFPIVINRTMHIIYLSMGKNWQFYQRYQNLIITITHCSFILNSSINPILYCWKHQGFRKAFKRTFKRQEEQRVRFARTPKIYPLDNKMDGKLVVDNSQTT